MALIQVTDKMYTGAQISAAFKALALKGELREDLDKQKMKDLILGGKNTTEDQIHEFLVLSGISFCALNINDFREIVKSDTESIEFLKSNTEKII